MVHISIPCLIREKSPKIFKKSMNKYFFNLLAVVLATVACNDINQVVESQYDIASTLRPHPRDLNCLINRFIACNNILL
jgi:cytosine/uracil/thiamine/allantoin permease